MKKTLFLISLLIFSFSYSFAQLSSLQDGLIVHYKFNGNSYDSSGNNFHTTSNATLTDDRFGNVNSAYHFNGINEYIDLPNISELKPNLPVTISFWVYFDDLDVTKTFMFTTDYAQNIHSGINMSLTSTTPKIAVAYGDAGAAGVNSRRTKVGTSTIKVNKWYFIIVTIVDALDMNIYINEYNSGNLCSDDGGNYSGSGSNINYTTNPGSIGRKDASIIDNPYYFQGKIDEFRLWNRELTSLETLSLCEFKNEEVTNTAPEITASGDQIYCPLSQMKVVTSFNITDPDDTTVDAFYIQISQGYKTGEDKLTLPIGSNPNISSSWNASEGKLTLKSINSTPATYADIIKAVKNVVFESSSPAVSGEKKFSFTIGDANYLPKTGHFYEYVPALGITWQNAKIAAEARTYYGLSGYLATITSTEEAKLSGEQAAGAGWIGGSDAASEGTWKWVTGPENGTVFWNGGINGSTPNFAFWNNGEPNQSGDEDYTHVTAPGVGDPGSWNDLSNTGASSGDYQPKGYIVEYGGTAGDLVLNLSASTTISVAAISATVSDSRCGDGILNLSATATLGATVLWFDSLTSITPLFIGSNYAPVLSTTKTFYVLASANGCAEGSRVPITATIYPNPTIISAPDVTICEGNSGMLNANASSTTATINWYTTPTGGISFKTGASFTTTPTTNITTYYVDATENGCTSPTRTEVKLEVLGNTLSATSPISLNDITIVDDSDNNSITIKIFPDFSNYEFNLDSFDEFHDETYFENLEPGIHYLYLRDKTSCDISKLDISILGFPKFFTPNDDGYNDTWKVIGNDLKSIQISAIYIFNRFGKLVAEVDVNGEGWDGFYNGERLPATNYWYLVKYTDQYGDYREKRGNLSLIRR